MLLAYSSAAARPLSAADLLDLLTRARKHNEMHGITGMLLYVDGAFFQVLEGNKDVLRALYEKIDRDTRHSNVLKLIEEPIDHRAFADWSMGYARATRDTLSTIPGLNDFFARGSSLNELESGRAKVLLEAFREGRWRRRLNA
ncbi:MAG: BLUF domain-containing protein [Acidobacteria bacterium]|nr:BLUF domain-containing protein [Acidobacteriota bacterium]